jgi:putative two-component system response regulator
MLSTQRLKESDEGEKSPLILVVDDTETHLELMEAILLKEGYRVQVTLNVHEAIYLAENLSPDMAILDVMMPSMNGYELCKKLKTISSNKFFPVILVTSLNQLEDKVTGLEVGADDFFSKPFNNIELTTKIRSLIKLKRLQDELENSEDIILTLAVAIEAKDPYTKGHSERVGNLSAQFAGFIGLSEKEIFTIKKGGILHDIGKIGLNESILHKKSQLSEEEIEVIRKHPTTGFNIVKPLRSLRQTLPIIKNHHERWDGKGFPDGLKGEKIPLTARIVNIVDTFDAMASIRPYRADLFTQEGVIRIMKAEKQSGQWDPYLLEKFIEMMEKHPC